MSDKSIQSWEPVTHRRGLWLQAKLLFNQSNRSVDEELDEIAKWSDINHCGRRMSYDMWQFKNPEQVTLFLLKWS
jgi:hypothetical protein